MINIREIIGNRASCFLINFSSLKLIPFSSALNFASLKKSQWKQI